MPVLAQSKHEKFAQLIAKGVSATNAYLSAGYAKVGAAQNASRLITNDKVLARIKERQAEVAERVVSAEIRRRNWRVQVLQVNLDRMRALIEARATEYAEHPAGASGILVKGYHGATWSISPPRRTPHPSSPGRRKNDPRRIANARAAASSSSARRLEVT